MATADEKIERFRLGEIGSLGLNIQYGVSNEEIKKELNFPGNIDTYKQMSYHPTINSAMTLFENLASNVSWQFTPLPDATEEEKRQCKIIEEMMHDMNHSWGEFISDVMSCVQFGFSVHEKVYRRRLLENGSKYNDGIIGWKKLSIRNQDTIEKFIFDKTGNEIIGVEQDLTKIQDGWNRFNNRLETSVIIPRSKFLLFRTGKHRGNPYGKSPLRNAYMAWRFLVIIEEIESNAVAKDLVGLPILRLPPQYLAADAPPEMKAIRLYYENALRNLQLNQQSAMMLPQMFDPETKQPLFDLELLSLDGKKGMDTVKVKEYYKNMILTSLFADVLVMGQTATGSFALGQIKNSLSGAAAKVILKSICDVLNSDLIKQTYELNGWNPARAGKFDFDGLEAADLETLSKYWQRVASVGLVEVDREVLNSIREAAGVDAKDDDEPVDKENLTGNASRAGDGMAKGSGNGTSDSAAGTDTSASNSDNSA